MKIKIYKDSTSFRVALESRLLALSKSENVQLQTLRRQISFDRFLMRLFHSKENAPWALKGGYAMELRIENSRTTKDIDLSIRDAKLLSAKSDEQTQAIRELLSECAEIDLNDFFTFKVGPVMKDRREFVKFHIDVGVGDVWTEPLEKLRTRDWLSFANIKSHPVVAISIEQQFAEKIHAYTLPREGQNSRVRDLVDMVLLLDNRDLDKNRFWTAIKATFERRNTHNLPDKLEPPPEDWTERFGIFAEECEIDGDIGAAFEKVKKIIDETRREPVTLK